MSMRKEHATSTASGADIDDGVSQRVVGAELREVELESEEEYVPVKTRKLQRDEPIARSKKKRKHKS